MGWSDIGELVKVHGGSRDGLCRMVRGIYRLPRTSKMARRNTRQAKDRSRRTGDAGRAYPGSTAKAPGCL